MTRSASAVSAVSDATAGTLPLEDDTEPEFYEGLFLSTVFRKLTAVQQSSFVLNLRLTRWVLPAHLDCIDTCLRRYCLYLAVLTDNMCSL